MEYKENPELLKGAQALVARSKRTVPRRILSALPEAAGTAVLVVGVPILVGPDASWTVRGLVVALAVACFVLLKISRDHLRELAAVNYAEYSITQGRRIGELEGAKRLLAERYEQGEINREALAAFSGALSEALKLNFNSHLDKPGRLVGSDYRISHLYKLEDIKAALRGLCRAVHQLVKGHCRGTVKVGVVVPDGPDGKETYRPIAVYHPDRSGYSSPHTFDSEHFTGRLLASFSAHMKGPEMPDYLMAASREFEGLQHVPIVPRDAAQQDTLRDMFGVVIYVHPANLTVPLGALNIDSSEDSDLPLQRLKDLQPVLRPVYRVIGHYLLLVRSMAAKEPDTCSRIQEMNEAQDGGGGRHD